MLDEIPYGEFIEIEGENVDEIQNIANLLELKWDVMVKAGYHALFERVAGKYNLELSDLSFAAVQNVKITRDDLDIQAADQM